MSRHPGQRLLHPPAPAAPALVLARVRRLLRKLQRLLDQPVQDTTSIHAIRVSTKKLRGWIRLLRHGAGRRKLRQHDKVLRKLARLLAGQRDADVRLDTLEWLQRRCTDQALNTHLVLLAKQTGTVTMKAPAPQLALPAALAPTLLRRPLSVRSLARGLAHGCARVISRARKATRPGAGARRLHAWRKQVKYCGYQLGLACADKRGNRAPLQAELAALGKVLGQVQDLTMLRKHLKPQLADPARQPTAAAIRTLAAQERTALSARAAVLFTALLIQPSANRVGDT